MLKLTISSFQDQLTNTRDNLLHNEDKKIDFQTTKYVITTLSFLLLLCHIVTFILFPISGYTCDFEHHFLEIGRRF